MGNIACSFVQVKIVAKVHILRMTGINGLEHPIPDGSFIKRFIPHLDLIHRPKPWITISEVETKTECIEIHFFCATTSAMKKFTIQENTHLTRGRIFRKSPMAPFAFKILDRN